MEFGYCSECGHILEAAWYIDYEEKNGEQTGRYKLAVSHLLCGGCGHKETIDDTFDENYHY